MLCPLVRKTGRPLYVLHGAHDGIVRTVHAGGGARPFRMSRRWQTPSEAVKGVATFQTGL